MNPLAVEPLEGPGCRNRLGEGIVWDDRRGCFWWTDIEAAELHRLDWPSRRHWVVGLPERLGSLALTQGSDFVGAFESGFARFTPDGQIVEWLARPDLPPGVRFNDGRVDRQGRFVAGTMVEDERAAGCRDAGALFRLEGASCKRLLGGIAISNGLCWSPDGATMYHADSPRGSSCSYRYGETLAGGRSFGPPTRGEGPDGATVDSQGNVWSARWGGSRLAVSDAAGCEIASLALPVSQPTCLAFGGPEFDILAVTTASVDLSDEQRAREPRAGDLLLFSTNVSGLREERMCA